MKTSAIITSLFFCICFACYGCGGTENRNNVKFICRIDGDSLTLPIKITDGEFDGHFYNFTSELSIPEIKDIIEKKSSRERIKSLVCEDRYILIERQSKFNQYSRYFIIYDISKESNRENRYVLGIPNCGYYVPIHFIEAEYYNGTQFWYLSRNTWYPTSKTIDDFVDFYSKVGDIYDISHNDDNVNITIKNTNIKGSHPKDGSFTIKFKQENEKTYVNYI